MKSIRSFISCLVLLLVGCQTSQVTSFAPLDARLEPIPGGGGQYLVLVNTSGRDMRNCSGSIYVWVDRSSYEIRRNPGHSYFSGPLIKTGQAVRIRGWATTVEAPITRRVTKVEIVAHCDEGYFREVWLNTDSHQLQRVSAAR